MKTEISLAAVLVKTLVNKEGVTGGKLEALPWVSPEKLKVYLHGQVDGLAEQMMAGINTARVGHLLDDSEEIVRQAGREFTRAAFEAAVQEKIDAAQAAFSPSGAHRDGSGDEAAAAKAVGE